MGNLEHFFAKQMIPNFPLDVPVDQVTLRRKEGKSFFLGHNLDVFCCKHFQTRPLSDKLPLDFVSCDDETLQVVKISKWSCKLASIEKDFSIVNREIHVANVEVNPPPTKKKDSQCG